MSVALPKRRKAKIPILTRVPRWVVHVVIFVFCAVWFTPLLAMVATSLRTNPDTAAGGWWMIFVKPLVTLDNFTRASDLLELNTSLVSTLAIAVPSTILTVIISAFGAYALARMHFRGKAFVFILLVALLAIPPQLAITPLLQLFGHLGLGGSIATVWIWQVGFTVPFGIFLVRGYLFTLPEELIEAARIDGASEFRLFFQIVLPLITPILASLAILQFLWSWNDLLTPLVFMGVANHEAPITLQLASLFQTQSGLGQNSVAAGAFISVIVPLAVLIGLQRYFVAGITGGSLKG
ncbi:carbohydrate ABC transporter permease [Subtercola vilae]|uniref:Carbohydrate ABC transporter permease n=1 Tax=Subtercola vilae TaxID=2056433 RepID=A0A4T2BYE6_9MICO|nr:carbohydrate ABC transporter permease [Subtercola vilae]TIH36610.1 carbohydrate ABC transporter permease [Subtercola vilae]